MYFRGRLSLDTIDPISPFGHLVLFTQRSFPLYLLGLSTAFYRLGLSTAFTVSKPVSSFFGLGLIRVRVRVRVCLASKFFLLNWRDSHFHEHFQLEISSKCDIIAENSSTWCKFHKGRKGLWPMGSNADRRRSQTLMAVKRHQIQARQIQSKKCIIL